MKAWQQVRPRCVICLRFPREVARPVRAFRFEEREFKADHVICARHEPVIELAYEHSCGRVLWVMEGEWFYRGEHRHLTEYKHNGARITVCPDCDVALPNAVPLGPTEKAHRATEHVHE